MGKIFIMALHRGKYSSFWKYHDNGLHRGAHSSGGNGCTQG